MKKNININQLVINPENYRFDPVDTQEQAINLMLEEKEDEILNLAKHIIENGLDEAKNFRVTEIKKDLYKILEGNRRLTAIKCLQNQSLVNKDSLKNKFVKISDAAKKSGKKIPNKISCFVYKTEQEAAKWIKLDHTGENKGIGLVKWGPAEQNRFEYKFGSKLSPTMQAIEFFQKQTGTKFDTKKLKITTIDRIISNPEARSYLGIDIINGDVVSVTSKRAVIDRLDKLFNKILTDNTPVSDVYHNENKISFMKNLFIEKPKMSKKFMLVSSNVKKGKIKSKKSLPKSSTRNTLIPYDCDLVIYENKINNIFHELRDDLLIDDSNKAVPNAVGVLFRVFLEVSLDYYAKKNQHSFKKDETIKKKIPWVVNNLILKGYEKDKFNNINKVGSAKKEETYLSIDNFHEYVHSFTTQPTSSDLKAKWDNLQEFFEILWGEITKKEREKRK